MIACDLGSNTIRFIEYDGQNFKRSYEKIVRTAQKLHQTGEISRDAIDRICIAIDEAKKELDFNTDIVALATAAMRIAKNSNEVIEQIYNRSGIVFVVIDAQKEAYLTSLAIKNRLEVLGIDSYNAIAIDIGGGSSEFSFLDSNLSYSANFGIVTIAENNKISINESIKLFKEWILNGIDIKSVKNLIFSSGTPTTVASFLQNIDYEHYDPAFINGFILSRKDTIKSLERLLSMDEATRARYVGVGREELIIVGIEMLIAVFDAFEIYSAIIVDDGLREGIAIDYYAKFKQF